ncbi:MAG: DUF3253 domain-containing protein [Sphingobacteriaceae bacterium]|nr:MAG: DUF3253 domain-containing protein [Sphingobacteriaceae bacterium]
MLSGLSEHIIEQAILKMATNRGVDKTICPSEVAREIFDDNWRNQMDNIRNVAFELEKAGKIDIMQKGQKINPNHIIGPIRIRIRLNND